MSTGNIILLALLIVGAIITLSGKKGKREKPRGRPYGNTMKDIFAFPEPETVSMGPETVMADPQMVSMEPETVLMTANTTHAPIDEGQRVTREASVEPDETPLRQDLERPNQVVTEFDVRQAVLGSEILKPKFDDYC